MSASLFDKFKWFMPNRQNSTIWVISVVAICIVGFMTYVSLAINTNPIPKELRQSLTFSPFVAPNNQKGYTTSDYKFSKTENGVQILSFIINLPNKDKVSVSEYTQPPEFTEIPEYKDRFMTNIANQYDTVQTSNGVIHLGRLSKQSNQQLGIMLERGLLVFLTPDQELDNAKWRSLGDELQIQKIID